MRLGFVKSRRVWSLVAGAGLIGLAAPAEAQHPFRKVEPCPPVPCPPPTQVIPPSTTPPGKPSTDPTTRPPLPDQRTPLDLSGAGPDSPLALGGPDRAFTPNIQGNLLLGSRSVFFSYLRSGGDISIAGSGATSVSNPKVGENNSPVPRDRVSFRYNYFANALSVTGISSAPPVFDQTLGFQVSGPASRNFDAHLYTFAVEKTCLDGMVSVEMRIPFQTTLASKLDLSAGNVRGAGPGTDDFGNPLLNVSPTPLNTLGREATEFGNMTVILKGLLYDTRDCALSGGLSVGIPTGQDTRVRVTDFLGRGSGPFGPISSIVRSREFLIKNETWSLSPFLGAVTTPSDRCFAQGFLQFEFPVNKSKVTYSERTTEPGFRNDTAVPDLLRQIRGSQVPPFSVTRRIDEQILMHVDTGFGYWVMRNPSAEWITGWAPTLELHYTTALEDADIATFPRDPSVRTVRAVRPDGRVEGQFVAEPAPQVGNRRNRVDIFNITVGNTLEIANRTTLATGVVFPLRKESDRTFDWEFQLQLNYYFGGPRNRPGSAF